MTVPSFFPFFLYQGQKEQPPCWHRSSGEWSPFSPIMLGDLSGETTWKNWMSFGETYVAWLAAWRPFQLVQTSCTSGHPNHFRVFREGLSSGLFESFYHWLLLFVGALQVCHWELPLHLVLGQACLEWRNSTIVWCWVEALECLTCLRQEVLGWTLCLLQPVVRLWLAPLRGGIRKCHWSRVVGGTWVPSIHLMDKLAGLPRTS